jgi:Ca-activated chloride channel family protein
MTLDNPWALIIAPLVATLALVRRRTPHHILTPFSSLLQSVPPSLRLRCRAPILAGGCGFIILLLSLAAARPFAVIDQIEPRETRTIILAIDISRSMEAIDFESPIGIISRFAGVTQVVSSFLERRHTDRIGLVVFGASAFVQSPVTHDHGLIAQLVKGLRVGIAGDGTALGDGLGVSVKRAVEVPARSRAVVLLTDGVNTAGSVSPQKAAEVARDLEVTVHTIGIGGTRGLQGIQGAEFDEGLLRRVAETTGGTYSNASSVEQLEAVYDRIEALELSRGEGQRELLVDEYYPLCITVALVLYVGILVSARTIFLKIP